MLPRVWLVPYRRGWSYDLTARALVECLSDRYEFRIGYTDEILRGEIARWPADVVVDMWWHGSLAGRLGDGSRVVKQISSHRWRQKKWGALKPTNLLKQYADDVAAIVVPSHRLFAELHSRATDRTHDIHIAAKGFDPALFFDQRRRGGPLSIGWAGAAEAKDKHVDILLEAEPTTRLADYCLTYREMADFYNDVDVIAIGSTAEGDPRPLIEGMACGCFPITTDVGIVPELVTHGENGLVVERSAKAFANAYRWAREHVDLVRAAGRRNAELMRRTRTWRHVAGSWARVFDLVIARSQLDQAV